MKCIYCQTDANYKTRQSNHGRCGACHHAFAFEPRRQSISVTDGLFQRAIKDVSGDGAVFFTERQLWYELNRRLWRRTLWNMTPRWGAAMALFGLGGIAGAVVLSSFWPLVLGVPGCGASVVMNHRERLRGPRYPPMPFDTFTSGYLAAWVGAHGPIERLLPSPVPRPAPRAGEAEPDLTAYSFDRALVTDRDEIAALLVANNFHFENNCAILSLGGYPGERADTVLTMLRRNPQLKVFAMHDASVEGCRLPLLLREERWFPGPTIPIMDLGLRPRHVEKLKLFTLKGAAPPAHFWSGPAGSGLQAQLAHDEVAWLQHGHTAELEALRPARLMRAIYQGFARAGQVDADTGIGGDGGFIWIADGGADIHAADSFG